MENKTSEFTEKDNKEIINKEKEQKMQKNILWVVPHRGRNTGNLQSWLWKNADMLICF